jgi:hypothetical protein
MFMQRGRVFDPLTFAQLGNFPLGVVSTGIALSLDTVGGRAFFLTNGQVRSFDAATLALLASVPFPRGFVYSDMPFVRWGDDGLAVLGYIEGTPRILLINGPFVRP